MELKSIGMKIKEQRLKKNISQERLAELIDVTPSYISNIENGNRIASLPTMMSIVNILDLSFDYLMLDNLNSKDNKKNIDKHLLEFKKILEDFDDDNTIKEFIIYCRGIANSIIEIKKRNKG